MSEYERTTINIEACIAEYERAIDERFMPALRKAIGDVLTEFTEGLPVDEFISVRRDTQNSPSLPVRPRRARPASSRMKIPQTAKPVLP